MSTKVKHGKIVRDSNGNRPRRFRMTNADIPIMVDAVFCGNPRKPGWIEMYVNGEGRKCVNATFSRGEHPLDTCERARPRLRSGPDNRWHEGLGGV